MPYTFDDPPERRGTDSFKWSVVEGTGRVPLWVADMDFASPPCVLEALRRRVEHGVFGYADAQASVVQSVVSWCERRYGWAVDPAWIVWLPGLVQGLHVACTSCAGPGESVATFTPVYPYLFSAPRTTGRQSVRADLVQHDGRWMMDLDALEEALQEDTRLLLVCHPHNPVGRAWRRGELERLAELCLRHDLSICSDEIHCDLALDDIEHTPFATLGPEVARRTITLMSAAKTFNIAGLNCGFAIIPDDTLRRRFVGNTHGLVPHPNALGYVATEAALVHGEPWRQDLLRYLRGNRDMVERTVAKLPGVSMTHVEATYLAWLDVRELQLDDPQAHFREAGLELSPGGMFKGRGWMRLNFGCPRGRLEEALRRLARATQR